MNIKIGRLKFSFNLEVGKEMNSDSRIKKFNCITDTEDSVVFDARGGTMSIDIFNVDNGEEVNIAVLLKKSQVKELIDFLQSNLGELTDK
jgi:hypothetical protein